MGTFRCSILVFIGALFLLPLVKQERVETTMMLIKRIDHIQLAAPIGGEDKARAFFQDVLSLEEVEKPHELKKNGGVWFSNGHIHIHVGIEEPFVPAKKAHPAFEVSDIEALGFPD